MSPSALLKFFAKLPEGEAEFVDEVGDLFFEAQSAGVSRGGVVVEQLRLAG